MTCKIFSFLFLRLVIYFYTAMSTKNQKILMSTIKLIKDSHRFHEQLSDDLPAYYTHAVTFNCRFAEGLFYYF